MAQKVLIISGPTATGKTALAVKLAQKYHGELISADSRQVYKGLDIGVGKDHPKGTPIHLIDIIEPLQVFSVAQFQKLAYQKISDIHSRGSLPIVVGCTGLYINSLISPFTTFNIKPIPVLRFLLSRLPLKTLQFILKTWDFNAYNTLNNSDLNNPYRLIRKIEICLSTGANQNINVPQYDLLHLSLTASNEYLYPRINQRVTDRLQLGHLNELKTLLARYPWSAPGLKVSAYACLRPYLERKESLATASFHWQAAEHRDARRQKTYFKKIPGARFVDISRPGWSKSVLTHVRKWYNQI